MPQEPQIELLSLKKRKQFFLLLCLIFIIALPAMIFYTTGYRLDFANPDRTIVTTGGMYITTDNLGVDVYLNDEQVRRPRLFRSAYYIQNIEAGVHRVVVQRDGLYTWVKNLPVDPYIVIEAAAFNMPETPNVRLIPEYIDPTGVAVYRAAEEDATPLAVATTANPFIVTASTSSSSLLRNPEYDFVATLFGTTTATSSTVIDRIRAQVERFGFATTSPLATTTVDAPVIVQKGNIRLVEQDGELVASWVGSANAVPYYFCLSSATATSTISERYGDHVARQIAEQRLSTTTPLLLDGERVCRQQIQIDRKQQEILYYDFVPGATDLVLLQLEDGLYVTEIDDRSWQNTQRVYPGNDYEVMVHSGKIFLRIHGHFVELLTRVEPLQQS